MTISRPPFPSVIDSTILAAFRSCPQKANLEFIRHWKSKAPSVHLHAGAAYAAGLEKAREAFYMDGLPSDSAEAMGLGKLLASYGDFECPPDSAKSADRVAGAYAYYFTQYPLSADAAVPVEFPGGHRGIEFSFLEPLDILHPETGDPILYSGRLDAIVEFAGAMYGLDDKTTSQLGASWSRQWDLRSQFTGYCWGAARAGYPLAGFLVRGISILKTKYETQQAITYRPQWMIDRWYRQTLLDIERMIKMWQTGEWDYNLDHACTEYGGCAYRQICLVPPESQSVWLATHYERRRWDPVQRTETLLGDE